MHLVGLLATPISIGMVLVGALFISLSLPKASKIGASLRDKDQLRRKWRIIFDLMVFFLVGYLLLCLALILEWPFPFEPVVAGVFLGGAVFVYLIIHIFQVSLAAKQKAEDSLRASEACFHQLFDSVSEAIVILDPESGSVLGMNDTLASMFGWSHDEFREIGMKALGAQGLPRSIAQWRGKVLDRQAWFFESLVNNKAGEKFWVEGNAHIAVINGIDRLLISMRDVNKRKGLEKRIARLNDCFLAFSERHDENIRCLTTLCGELLDGVCALYNRQEGQMLYTMADWNAPADFQRSDQAQGHLCSDVIKRGGDRIFCVRDLEQTLYAQTDPNVKRYGLQTYVGMPVKCRDTAVGSLCVVFQKDFVPSEEDEKFLGILAGAISVEEERRLESEALQRAHDELESRVQARTAELAQANERLRIDIVKRKQTEEALWKSESILRKLFEAIPDLLAVIDPDLRIVHSNWKGGYEYVTEERRNRGIHCYDAFYPENGRPCDECHVLEVFRTGRQVSREKYNPRIGQVEVRAFPILDDAGQVILVAEYIRDITEQRRVEEELRKTQKLESLGVLAGGIAHDFNNLLTAVLGNVSLARVETAQNSETFARLGDAVKAVGRARDLTQQLMTFSKGGAPVKKTACIEQIVRESVSFVLRGANVRCEFRIADNLRPVEVDEGQMNQVINNLIINACQSMESGGIVDVDIENYIVPAQNDKALKEGPYVRIIIQDHGAGIPEKYIHKIFDPYFTTKQTGSGLGLATVYSIVKHHDGYVGVESQPGAGAKFQVYLPASANPVPAETPSHENLVGGSGRILVMDDEKLIRGVASALLDHLGYSATTCCDGSEAIELYRQAMAANQPFAAVIMDLTIPGGMGGRETMQKLLEIDSRVVGIVSSGYSNDPILAGYRDFGFSGIVAKPYSLGELSQVLYDLLAPDVQ